MRKPLLIILFSIIPIAMLAKEYSGRGIDYNSEHMGVNGAKVILTISIVLGILGLLMRWGIDNNDNKDDSNQGCLRNLSIILIVIAAIGFLDATWSLASAFIITPVVYFVSYLFSVITRLIIAFFVILIIPSILYGLTFAIHAIKYKIIIGSLAYLVGFATDVYLYTLLPPDTITVETFFPKWDLEEQMDKQLYPEKYEE